MGIPDNIKRLREIHGLSQEQLAGIAGVTDKAVSTWENGVNEPRMGAIQRIADYFGIKKSNIIEDSGLDGLYGAKTDRERMSRGSIHLDALEFALFGEVRELDDEDKEELLRDARRMRELRELRRKQKEQDNNT